MTWISLVLTLLLEQLRGLSLDNPIYQGVRGLAGAAEHHLNAGRRRHGFYAWVLLVGGLTLATGLVWGLLAWFSWVLALAFNVAVLYLTLGFRQFSHRGTEVQIALANGDLQAARRELTAWKQQYEPGFSAMDLDAQELVRQTIEHGLLLSQRHVFGVFFWFLVVPGPAGAVFYRLADYLARRWNRPLAGDVPPDRFGHFARQAMGWIDWIPARLTAIGFAIVGDFEGAIFCWRQVARVPSTDGTPTPDARTLILATASGALDRRLMTTDEYARVLDEAGQGPDLPEPVPATVRSAVGLVWRALLLWLALLLLLTIARWVS